tara:strand:+ start:1129 stop:1290 length:162 start_codon:yes stop_codon:yes gene_type:complete
MQNKKYKYYFSSKHPEFKFFSMIYFFYVFKYCFVVYHNNELQKFVVINFKNAK